MIYKCLKSNEYHHGDYTLVPLREQDILYIKDWRNEQIEVLRQKKLLSDKDQIRYYKNHVFPLFNEPRPFQILLSYLKEDRCIGYGGLTNIDWEYKRTELSYLAETVRARDEKIYSEDFTSYLVMIKKVVFEDLSFNRIFTETFDIRPLHVLLLEKSGFRYEGRLKKHVYINDKYTDSLIHGYLKEYYESGR